MKVKVTVLCRDMKKQINKEYVSPSEIELYLVLCKQMYERMEKAGFPWEKEEEKPDGHNFLN